MTKRFPSEFAINMVLDKMIILQQPDLKEINKNNYFNESSPCHLYFIGKRPRVIIDHNKMVFHDNNIIEFFFKVQYQDTFKETSVKIDYQKDTSKLSLQTSYPYNIFKLLDHDKEIMTARASVFVQSIIHSSEDFLDFEVLYIGQSYGVDGARTAPDRLAKHSTLQGIYSEAIVNNPDSEVWLALASFEQLSLMMFDGRTKFTKAERKQDKNRFMNVYNRIHNVGLNEQQVINFTEAALIKYFQPPYNKIYKDTFPNPAHTTYEECYELDINSICIEMQTSEMVNCRFYSDAVERAPWNMETFLLHSTEDRKSMFELI